MCKVILTISFSLYVNHDEKGWWLTLGGSSLGWSEETVKFYLALVDHNIPVFLIDGREIADMITSKDYIGIVLEGIIPRYCDSLFPKEKMLSFMNLPWDETEKVIKAAIWYPIRETRLS